MLWEGCRGILSNLLALVVCVPVLATLRARELRGKEGEREREGILKDVGEEFARVAHNLY